MVKTGYKQTEVGEIPEDWSSIPSGQAVNFFGGYGFSSRSATDNGIPWLKIANVGVGSILWDAPSYLPFPFENQYKNFKLDAGDVVMALTRPILGNNLKIAKLSPHDAPSLLNQRVAKIQERHGYDREYLYFVIQREQFIAAMNLAMAGTDPPNIGTTALHKIYIPVPTQLKEQIVIAKALSNVDELIVSLEKLIAKKRDIKTGTMQQLLTGKQRLAGFDSEWRKIKIENDATLKARIGWQALTTNEYLEFGAFHLVTGTDFINGRINWSTCHFVDKWRFDQDRNIQLKEGDVLLTKDGTIGKVGYVDHLDIPSTLNSGVFVIRPINEAFHPLFLYYILSSRIFDEFLFKITAGSTITHLYQKDFVNFEFKAPNVDEQIEIANILESLDKDIDCCQKRLDKAKSIKQGMMQELLTGRTRLI